MKSLKKSKFVLTGFCLWLTVFSTLALTQGTAFEQTLLDSEIVMAPGRNGRYALRYQLFADTKITIKATSNVTLYFLVVNYAQWNESNQQWYYNEENYLTGEGLAYTHLRTQESAFELEWTETSNDIRYIVFQNEQEGDALLSVVILRNDLSTIAMYFGIGSVVILAGFFGWIFMSRKKVVEPVSEE